MANVQTAFSLMKDLRVILDRRLTENEDYRALKALDKALMEVKIGSDIAQDERAKGEYVVRAPSNPVADVQNQVSARFGA